MNDSDQTTDEQLLAALSARLQERRKALAHTAEVLDEVRAVNAKLEAAERLKGRFLSNIRNEINNPLTTVRGFAAALVANPDLPHEQVAAMAAGIYRDVSDLSFQMQNIFAAADYEAGCAAPDPARVNVPRLVAEVVQDFRALAEFREISVKVTGPESLAIVTDPAKLALVLSNLLRNAIEFCRAEIEIQVTAAESEVRFEVIDDGPGIPAAKAEHIFDRFVQLSEGSTKSHPGHGLGLSVAQACSDSLGGNLELVASEAGAHFRVTLPRQEQDAADEDAESANEFLFDAVEVF